MAVYFRTWKMALAAMIALLHDLVITVGIYALVGFEVTPATVIGFLTILGYSLYDTVVVFDKVRENTQGLPGTAAYLQPRPPTWRSTRPLVRSINTTVVALLPIGAILFVGIACSAPAPLKDLSLALFIGIAAGAYSSIFIATPLLGRAQGARAGDAGAGPPGRRTRGGASVTAGRGGRRATSRGAAVARPRPPTSADESAEQPTRVSAASSRRRRPASPRPAAPRNQPSARQKSRRKRR